jgi:scyllo-inositol 2-dehydrogenase (NADP+)
MVLKMKFGTVGTSGITDSFLEAAKTVENFEHAAVFSRSPETGRAFARKHGVQAVFNDLTQMALSDEIDAVYIASPNALHYEQSKLFLEHGKHVLCEKPITVTPDQLRELQGIADSNRLIYMEAIIMLHLPVRLQLKEALKRIGKITSARFDYSQLSSKYPAYLEGKMPNIFNPKLAAGCLMDLGVYCVYPALDFFGRPDRVITSAGFLKTGTDGLGSSLFLYKDKQVTISYSKLGNSRLGSEIIGDRGTIVINSISKLTHVKIVWNDTREESIIGDVPGSVFMRGEAQDFYRFVTGADHWEEEYRYAEKLALEVSETMQLMRQQAGIILG